MGLPCLEHSIVEAPLKPNSGCPCCTILPKPHTLAEEAPPTCSPNSLRLKRYCFPNSPQHSTQPQTYAGISRMQFGFYRTEVTIGDGRCSRLRRNKSYYIGFLSSTAPTQALSREQRKFPTYPSVPKTTSSKRLQHDLWIQAHRLTALHFPIFPASHGPFHVLWVSRPPGVWLRHPDQEHAKAGRYRKAPHVEGRPAPALHAPLTRIRSCREFVRARMRSCRALGLTRKNAWGVVDTRFCWTAPPWYPLAY